MTELSIWGGGNLESQEDRDLEERTRLDKRRLNSLENQLLGNKGEGCFCNQGP